MGKRFYIAASFSAVGILIIGLVSTMSRTSALVPGINAAIDKNTSGTNPNSNSSNPSSSQDGRYIAFQSRATDLVSPTTNGFYQIFVRDRLNNTTTLVSVSSAGTQGNSYSQNTRISADGRYVVFESNATNLVSGDTNGALDVFIHDMSTGTTLLTSANSSGTQGNNTSQDSDVSADGNYVVFDSYATNLISSPSVSHSNIYLKNMSTGAVQLLSQSASGVDENADSSIPKISCEGRIVTYGSYGSNLVSGDTYDTAHNILRIYTVDMLKPISPMYILAQPTASSTSATISCNGDYLAFTTDATNYVSGDTNGVTDAIVYDRINNSFERASVSTGGTQGNGASTGYPTVSNDGKYIAFASSATNLVSGDTNNVQDIFLRNRQAGTTELISQNNGTIADSSSIYPNISSDGKYVTYISNATNLVSGFSGGRTFASQTGAGNDY